MGEGGKETSWREKRKDTYDNDIDAIKKKRKKNAHKFFLKF
jgi:hypothetical protein